MLILIKFIGTIKRKIELINSICEVFVFALEFQIAQKRVASVV